MKVILLAVLFMVVSSLAVPAQSMFDKVNDFDGDGRSDYAVTRNESGLKVWHLWRSTAGYAVVQWGIADDFVTAGDYDGDSRTDIAVTRLTSVEGRWLCTTYYLASSSGSTGIVQVDAPNAVGSLGIMNEDYDGDGKTDPAIFQWHAIGGVTYRKSSTGTIAGVTTTWFQVRAGDITGDNAAEVVSTSGSGETTVKDPVTGASYTVGFGTQGDRFVAADFDGDNKGEIAVFRPTTGVWWWIRSSDFVVNAAHWGLSGDTPVPADYDDDGRTDLAIYRPGSPSTYWVLNSGGGSSAFAFGLSTDLVVTY